MRVNTRGVYRAVQGIHSRVGLRKAGMSSQKMETSQVETSLWPFTLPRVPSAQGQVSKQRRARAESAKCEDNSLETLDS